MKCPDCDGYVPWGMIEDECIEANDVFSCPSCEVALRYWIDEGTYYGAQHTSIEVVDD